MGPVWAKNYNWAKFPKQLELNGVLAVLIGVGGLQPAPAGRSATQKRATLLHFGAL